MIRRYVYEITRISLTLLAAAVSGCKLSLIHDQEQSSLNSPVQVALQAPAPAYSRKGANWMDYVRSDGADIYSASDTIACDGTETGYNACIHGGEMRMVDIPSVSSCDGLTLTDSLGVFTWTCVFRNGKATFYSTGFQPGKGLRNLIDVSGWKSASVTVSGAAIGSSPSSKWWTNPIRPLPTYIAVGGPLLPLDGTDDDGGAPGDGSDEAYAPGTILVLPYSQVTRGYSINIDKLAVVTLPGARLIYNGDPAGNCGVDHCILYGGMTFNWIEGDFDADSGGGTDSDYGLYFWGMNFGTIHNTLVRNQQNIGLRLNATTNSRITDFRGANNGFNGSVYLDLVSDHNYFDRIVAVSSPTGANAWGILLMNASDNVFSRLDIASTTYEGITIYGGSSRNVFQQVVVQGTHRSGIVSQPTATGVDNVFSLVTVVNGSLPSGGDHQGIDLEGMDRSTFLNTLVVNNYYGLLIDGNSNNNTFVNLVVTDSSDYGVEVSGSTGNKFSGTLLVGNNGGKDCAIVGAPVANRGVIDTTCTDTGIDGSGAFTGQLSNALFRTGKNLASSFLGKVLSNDAVNSSDANGFVASYPLNPKTFDWTGFENLFRGWGRDHSDAFPSLNHRSSWEAGAGRIWDWRLLKSDTALLNRTADGSGFNGNFVPGSTCPGAVQGNRATTDQYSGGARTFLVNAVEILGDGIGNDNGLCESHESCLYTPNYGAYQGDGNLVPCKFDDANGTTTVVDVKMYGYESNGI